MYNLAFVDVPLLHAVRFYLTHLLLSRKLFIKILEFVVLRLLQKLLDNKSSIALRN